MISWLCKFAGRRSADRTASGNGRPT